MKVKKYIFTLLLFSFLYESAQVMNVRKWRKSEKDSLDNAMYLIDEAQYQEALPIFDDLLKHHPKEEFLRYTFAKCALYRSDKHEDAYNYLTELYQKNNKIPDVQFDMALAAHYNYKFDEASRHIQTYLSNRRLTAEERKNAEMLVVYIGNARRLYNTPTAAKIKLLGTGINTEGEEIRPLVTADDQRLIYSYKGKNSLGGVQNSYLQPDPLGDYTDDLYYSDKEESAFSTGTAIQNLNTNAIEAGIGISQDGQHLFLYQDFGDGHGDIYLSTLMGNVYSTPVKLRGEINSYSRENYCSLSPDGKTIYFSSDRGGGFGGFDLYKATLTSDSTWTNVTNLGDSINTPYDEDYPFIHGDGRSLYYSSKNTASMGGYDVFRSVMGEKDSLFRKGQNMGYPINTTFDDRYFVLTASGKKAYYSQARKDGHGRNDLYAIETNFADPIPALMLVKGKTLDDKNPVPTEITVEITNQKDRVYRRLRSNEMTGEYLVCLPAGNEYRLVYRYKDKEAIFFMADATTIEVYEEKLNDVDFHILPVAVTPTITPSSSLTAGVAGATKSPTTAGVAAPTPPVPVKTAPPAKAPTLAGNTPTVSPFRTAYFPANALQEKTLRYVERFGSISAPDLEFRVQIAAVKVDHNTIFPNQARLGQIDKIDLGDGFTRIMAGGKFNTMAQAYEHNRIVVKAGITDGFVTAIYKGKKVNYEYLEQIGIFK